MYKAQSFINQVLNNFKKWIIIKLLILILILFGSNINRALKQNNQSYCNKEHKVKI